MLKKWNTLNSSDFLWTNERSFDLQVKKLSSSGFYRPDEPQTETKRK